MSDAKQIADLVGRFRRVLDRVERAPEPPLSWLEIQSGRDACRQAMLVADRLQRNEDDGK